MDDKVLDDKLTYLANKSISEMTFLESLTHKSAMYLYHRCIPIGKRIPREKYYEFAKLLIEAENESDKIMEELDKGMYENPPKFANEILPSIGKDLYSLHDSFDRKLNAKIEEILNGK